MTKQTTIKITKEEMEQIRERKELEAIMADCELWEDVHYGDYSGDYWD